MSESLMEVFKKRRMEKEKSRQDTRINKLTSELLVLKDDDDISKYEKEFTKVISDMKSLLKKEIPGVKFNSEKITNSSSKLDDRYTLYTQSISYLEWMMITVEII